MIGKNYFGSYYICCSKGISLKPWLNQTWPFSLTSALISFSFNVKLQPLLDLCHVESSGSGGTFGLRLFLHFPVKTVHTSPTMTDDAFPAEWLENSDIPSPEKDTHTLSPWPWRRGAPEFDNKTRRQAVCRFDSAVRHVAVLPSY